MFFVTNLVNGVGCPKFVRRRFSPVYKPYYCCCSRQSSSKVANTLVSLWLVATKCCLPSSVLAVSLQPTSPCYFLEYVVTSTWLSPLRTSTVKQQKKIQTIPFRALQLLHENSQPIESRSNPPHLGLQLVTKLRKLGLPDALVLFIISSLPVLELRGAIPIGVWMGLSLAQVYFLSVAGNLLPVPLLLYGLRHPKVRQWLSPMLKRADRMKQQIANDTFREIALALFVGVPLPGTGAWSGAIIAFVLNMPFWGAIASITSGVLMAGLIMLILTKMGKIGALLATAVLLGTGVSALWRTYKTWSQSPNDEPGE